MVFTLSCDGRTSFGEVWSVRGADPQFRGAPAKTPPPQRPGKHIAPASQSLSLFTTPSSIDTSRYAPASVATVPPTRATHTSNAPSLYPRALSQGSTGLVIAGTLFNVPKRRPYQPWALDRGVTVVKAQASSKAFKGCNTPTSARNNTNTAYQAHYQRCQKQIVLLRTRHLEGLHASILEPACT
jgi:hypothetical protein